jgi:hypothetical protein
VQLTGLTRRLGVLGLTLGMAHASPALAQLNVTVVGALGDLDGSGDGGTGEAAVVQSAVACWAARVGTNRNFTLTVMGGALTGGTIGQGTVTSNTNIPTTGRLTMDNDGSTVYFVDATPLVSAEFQPDPANQWRFVNGAGAAGQTDLFSVVTHEIGHALGWVCGQVTGAPIGCGFFNPLYDGLMNPTPANFVNGTVVNLTAGGVHPLNVPLRGDGLGTQNQVVNELSHPGIVGDLRRGFYTGGTRELQSEIDVDMFAHAYADAVNLPPTVNAGTNILSECNATGGSNVTLNGTGTDDPENGALTFAWSCPGVPLVAANSASPGGFFALDSTTTCRLDVADLAACPASASTVDVRVRDTIAPTVTCPAPISVECTAPGGTPAGNASIAAFLNGASATDVCDATLTIGTNAPPFFNLGSTPVLFSTADQSLNAGSCSAAVTVVDTTAPTITSVTATPDGLWPPNHQMVPVTVSVSVADICSSTTCQIVSVASNQPVNGAGDGNTTPDWTITGPLTLDVRAERAGMLGDRIYTVTVACGDGSGNSSMKSVAVTVPHAQN